MKKTYSKETLFSQFERYAKSVNASTSTEQVLLMNVKMDAWCVREIQSLLDSENEMDSVLIDKMRCASTALAVRRMHAIDDGMNLKSLSFKLKIVPAWNSSNVTKAFKFLKSISSEESDGKELLRLLRKCSAPERLYILSYWKEGVAMYEKRWLKEQSIYPQQEEEKEKSSAKRERETESVLPQTTEQIKSLATGDGEFLDGDEPDGLYVTKDGWTKNWPNMTYEERLYQLKQLLELRLMNLRCARDYEVLLLWYQRCLNCYELWTTGKCDNYEHDGKVEPERLSDDKFIMDFGEDKQRADDWFSDTLFSNFAIGCITVSKKHPSQRMAVMHMFEKMANALEVEPKTFEELQEKYVEHEKKKDASYAFKSVPF